MGEIKADVEKVAAWLKHSRDAGLLHVSVPCDEIEALIREIARSRSEREGLAGRIELLEPGVKFTPMPDTLNAAVQKAARDLPDGFQIHVDVEKGAGWVSLDYPGVAFEYSPNGVGMTLSEQIVECVEKAKATPVIER